MMDEDVLYINDASHSFGKARSSTALDRCLRRVQNDVGGLHPCDWTRGFPMPARPPFWMRKWQGRPDGIANRCATYGSLLEAGMGGGECLVM